MYTLGSYLLSCHDLGLCVGFLVPYLSCLVSLFFPFMIVRRKKFLGCLHTHMCNDPCLCSHSPSLIIHLAVAFGWGGAPPPVTRRCPLWQTCHPQPGGVLVVNIHLVLWKISFNTQKKTMLKKNMSKAKQKIDTWKTMFLNKFSKERKILHRKTFYMFYNIYNNILHVP